MHLFGWLSERGGNFLNLLKKAGVPRKGEGGGGFPQKRGVPTLEETMQRFCRESQGPEHFINQHGKPLLV